MRWLQKLRTKLATVRRSQANSDLDSELRFHLDQQIAENLAAGMNSEEARRAAIHSFGNLSAIREETRSTWSWTSVESWFRDLDAGLRSLSRSPGFTCTAILVIALGLGANIAIFAVVRSVLLKPLPFHDPSRLIVLYQGQQKDHEVNLPIDAGSFWEWQRAANNSAELALFDPSEQYDLSIRGGELPEKIVARCVSWNFFHVLGVQPTLGRTFSQSDDSLSAPATVILMDSLWHRRFNADPAVIGTQIWLNARPYTVIGVMPSWFRFEAKMGGGSNGKSLLAPLQESSRGNSASQSRTGLRRTLLAAEVGLTVILLIGAGLLLKSYLRLRTTSLGISSDNVLTMQFNLPEVRYPKPVRKAVFMEEVLREVRAVPGVEAAGLITTAPGQGSGGDFLISILEHPPHVMGGGLDFLVRAADPGYFAAAGIPILRGRTFASRERLDHASVVLISQQAANRFFPNEDPVGKHLRIDYTGQVFQIIGVVGDTRWTVSQPDNPTLYMPIFGNNVGYATLLIRSTRKVKALSIPIQRVINTMDRDLPVSSVETLRETIGKSTLGLEFNSLLVLGFAVIGLVLAAAGLYGVLAYLVAQRTNEIGVRIALGAQRAQILRLTLLDGLRPALLGLVIGLAGSAAVAKLIRSLLYGVEPYDSAIFLAVAAILLAVAVVACTIPAWRASSLDPLQALRVE